MQLSSLLAIAGLVAAATISPTATPAPYSGGDTSGCGKTHLFNGLPTARTLLSGGKQRRYLAHLPTTYDPRRRYPVIVGFHGSSSVGFFFEADTGLDLPRYTADKITVYPDGLGGAWAGANYSAATVAEDLRFVRDLLADLRAEFCVDSARVYATGLSSGGGFVGTIACDAEAGAEFAAFAPAAGAFYTDNDERWRECRPARVPVPMLEFHGGADGSVRYEGGEGEGGVEPSIPDWLGRWAERNGCDAAYEQEDLYGGDVHHLSWTCKGQEGVLQHYKTDDQKHDWPSPWPNFSQLAALDKPTHLEASAIIQDFFMRFTRPEDSTTFTYAAGAEPPSPALSSYHHLTSPARMWNMSEGAGTRLSWQENMLLHMRRTWIYSARAELRWAPKHGHILYRQLRPFICRSVRDLLS